MFWRIIFICFALISCVEKQRNFNNWMKQEGKIKILSTTRIISSIVEEIGKDKICSITLIPDNLDPHNYELVKGDFDKLQRADIIFYNGLGLESNGALDHFLKNDEKAISIGEQIKKYYPHKIIEINKEIDPHIWLDLSLWIQSVEVIKQILLEKDPRNGKFYVQNAIKLKREIRRADKRILSLLEQIPPVRRYLVTSHSSFNYFVVRYLREESKSIYSISPEGFCPEGQISPLDLKNVLECIEKYKIGVLFPEAGLNFDSLKKILFVAQKKGLEVKIADGFLYSDSMPRKDFSYLDLMNYNARLIFRNLSAKE